MLKTFTSVDDKFTASFGRVKDDIKDVNHEIGKRILKSHAFVKKIFRNFKKLEENIIHLIYHGFSRRESPTDEWSACMRDAWCSSGYR